MRPNHKKLYQIAEQQAGYFAARQAREAGFTRSLLSHYARTGHFERIKRGIYRLGQFPDSPCADLFVAWLQTGPKSVISHESALAVYELADVLPGEIHMLVSRTASRRRKGIRLHTSRLSADEITRRAGLPVTTVPRTIADAVVSGLAEEQVRQAIREAVRRGLVTPEALLAHAARRGGRVARVIGSALKPGEVG